MKEQVFPDLLDIMRKRFEILQTISVYQPIGRRGISNQTGYTERFIRNEIDQLENLNLIQVTTKGVIILEKGKNVLDELFDYMNELSGLFFLEDKLQQALNLKRAIIVSGNSDEDEYIKMKLGQATVSYLKKTIQKDVTIAVTGGTTMAAVAKAMTPINKYNCLFVPARGGLGERVENESNTIVAQMANAEKGKYHLLHAPEPLSESLYQSLLKEPSVKNTLKIIKKSDIVIHGIGDAIAMAKRRKLSDTIIESLIDKKAVGEAFGYYFDKYGKIVHKIRTFGIQIEDLQDIPNLITVAGGLSKAQAIIAYMSQGYRGTLITDEAAALEILKNIKA